ncbi:MAG: NUDIX hydrolase [Eubacteriaceae bacterium]|jgi:ADP-ribose pyrophosphatase|nr:NUDIX hydrolase [Eubacteriaceae bacterium]
MKEFYEKTIASTEIFSGRILNLRVETVALPNGQEATRELVEHKDAVAVLPITEEGHMVFVKQYRKALDIVLLEIPAGLLEEGEDPFEAASRELQEEIGLKPLDLIKIGEIWPSAGFSDEKTCLFIATEFEESKLPQDEDEFLEIVRIPIPTVKMLYRTGKIRDAKTHAALGFFFSLYNES